MSGERHSTELDLDEGYTLDLALPERRVGLVLGSRLHFDELPGPDGRHAPKVAVRLAWRQMGALGWTIVPIPFYEWDACDSAAARREYLAQRLAQAQGDSVSGKSGAVRRKI